MEDIAAHLRSWTDRAGVPMLVGATRYEHLPGSDEHGTGGLRRFNAAILFEPNRQVLHFYHKMHLVPFGEYFPLIESLPWLAALTPYRGEKLRSLDFGREPLSLPLGPYRLAVSICFEDTIPHVIRQSFADVERRAAGRAHQPVERRLVSWLGRAGYASCDRCFSRHRKPRAAGALGQYGPVGPG